MEVRSCSSKPFEVISVIVTQEGTASVLVDKGGVKRSRGWSRDAREGRDAAGRG